jgi:GTP:adenosylcobinamide-phosphate guanylyltransferase
MAPSAASCKTPVARTDCTSRHAGYIAGVNASARDELPRAGVRRAAALVLAGRRTGGDALSPTASCRHKALLPVRGVPMLVRVLRTLLAEALVDSVTVSIDDPAVLSEDAEIAELLAGGRLRVHRSLASPSLSVCDFVETLPADTPLLVTTADHPLLTGEMIEHFWLGAEDSDADVVVGLVSSSVFRASFPNHRRTLIRLRDDSYGGSNLFAFRGPGATTVTAFWSRAERYRKQPWRLVGMFGPLNLALFLTRRLDLEDAMRRASARIGAKVGAVRMPFAESAIDVDSASDLAAAESILASRDG